MGSWCRGGLQCAERIFIEPGLANSGQSGRQVLALFASQPTRSSGNCLRARYYWSVFANEPLAAVITRQLIAALTGLLSDCSWLDE